MHIWSFGTYMYRLKLLLHVLWKLGARWKLHDVSVFFMLYAEQFHMEYCEFHAHTVDCIHAIRYKYVEYTSFK